MKKCLSIVLSILIAFNIILVVSATIPSDIAGTQLQTDYVVQEKSKWCWAATAENAIIWEGSPTRDQADAVRHIKGTLFDPYPDEGGGIYDIRDAAEYISENNEDYTAVRSQKPFDFISEEIYDEHPVLAGTSPVVSGLSGHAVLIVGWNTSTGTERITYFDSADGSYRTCLYTDFCNGSFNGRSYIETCYNTTS